MLTMARCSSGVVLRAPSCLGMIGAVVVVGEGKEVEKMLCCDT